MNVRIAFASVLILLGAVVSIWAAEETPTTPSTDAAPSPGTAISASTSATAADTAKPATEATTVTSTPGALPAPGSPLGISLDSSPTGAASIPSTPLVLPSAETKPADTSDSADTADSVPAVDPKEKEAAQADFQSIFTEWKTFLGDLAALQIKYRSANEAKRLEIQDQWNLLIVKGEALQDRLIAAAEKAYALAPDEDPELPAFLFRLLVGWNREDNYESADRIAKLLMKNHYKQPRLAVQAGIAAFAVADFDSAEQYFKEAIKTGGEVKTDNDNLDNLIRAFLADPPTTGKEPDAKKPLSLREYMKEGWTKEKQIRENEANADNLPRVLLKTTKGNIELELFENDAPNTVANFIYLVEKKFYNNVSFHRVLPGFMAQGGDPKGDGTGGPGYAIPCECYKLDYRHHFRGSLSMAHAGPNTGGSQFFLTFVPTVSLDGVHTVFGRVVSGMDVLAKLQRVDPAGENVGRPDRIIEAQVLRKRSHEYFPKKVE